MNELHWVLDDLIFVVYQNDCQILFQYYQYHLMLMVVLIRRVARNNNFIIQNISFFSFLLIKPVVIDHHILIVNVFLFHVDVENVELNHRKIQMQIIYDYYLLH